MGNLKLVLMLAACLLLAFAIIPGCSEEKSDEEKMQETLQQMRKAFEERISEGQEPPSELLEKSEFAAKVGSKNYPEAQVPEGKQLFRWDFSKKRKFAYDYEQTVKTNNMGTNINMDATATISMNTKGDKTATLVFKDMKTSMFAGMKQPPVVLQGVTEDSKLPGGIPTQADMVKLLFPLPDKLLAVGESASVPTRMPFNAYGSLLWVEGETKITLAKYVTIDDHICAKFDLQIDISRIDVPEELGGEYRCSTKGTGVTYFDTKDRCFHSGEMAIVMSVRTKPPEDSPMQVSMATDSDNLMKFARNKDKEKEEKKD